MNSVSITHPRELFGFEVLAALGQGARSTIYAVKDEKNQVYALKHVVKEESEGQRFLDQALTDHQVASQFNHKYLRRSFKLLRHRKVIRTNEIAILMEMIDGPTLEEAKIRNLHTVCSVCYQAAVGLKHMHDAGYVHADIKPNNIILTDQGLIKIIDFGQSCEIGTIKPRIQGTPDYIAPEQVHRHPIVPQTDIFNLGATMYWILTGRHIPTLIPKGEPGLTPRSDESCPSPREINPAVPLALSNLAMLCIQTDLKQRPESMDQVCSRLDIAARQLSKQPSLNE